MNLKDMCVDCFKDTGGEDVCMNCGFEQSSLRQDPDALQPHTVLNKYIIGRVIHVGRESYIYKAYNMNLGMTVAIKEFFPRTVCAAKRMPDGNVAVVAECAEVFYQKKNVFLNTSRLIRNAAIENVITFFDEFEANETAYQVMEFVEGLTLDAYFHQVRSLSFEEALNVMIPMMEAVEELHNVGIVCQDLSPQNIFISTTGDIKLFGFGNIKNVNSRVDVRPMPVEGFSAPEVYAAGRTSRASDIYSMGAIWFKILSGITPPSGQTRLKRKKLVPFNKLDAGLSVPELVEAVVFKAMSVKPEQRFSNMRDFIESLNGEGWKPKTNKLRPAAILTIVGVIVVLLIGAAVALYVAVNNSFIPMKDATIELWYVESGNPALDKQRWKTVEKDFEQYAKSQRKSLDLDLVVKPVKASAYDKELQQAMKNGTAPAIYDATTLTDDENAYSLERLYAKIDDRCKDGKGDETAFSRMKALFADANKIAFYYDLPIWYNSISGLNGPTSKLTQKEKLRDFDQKFIEVGNSTKQYDDHLSACNPDAMLYGAYAYGYSDSKDTGDEAFEILYRRSTESYLKNGWDVDGDTYTKYFLGFISEYNAMVKLKGELQLSSLTDVAKKKMGYIYPEVWSINKNAAQESIDAAIFLLYYLANTDDGQSDITNENGTGVRYVPINKEYKGSEKESASEKEYSDLIKETYPNICKTADAYAKESKKARLVASNIRSKKSVNETLKKIKSTGKGR